MPHVLKTLLTIHILLAKYRANKKTYFTSLSMYVYSLPLMSYWEKKYRKIFLVCKIYLLKVNSSKIKK